MLTSCVIDEKAKTVTIVMPLEEPRRSSTGKTDIIFSASGPTGVAYGGKPVKISCNGFVKADEAPAQEEAKGGKGGKKK